MIVYALLSEQAMKSQVLRTVWCRNISDEAVGEIWKRWFFRMMVRPHVLFFRQITRPGDLHVQTFVIVASIIWVISCCLNNHWTANALILSFFSLCHTTTEWTPSHCPRFVTAINQSIFISPHVYLSVACHVTICGGRRSQQVRLNFSKVSAPARHFWRLRPLCTLLVKLSPCTQI